MNTTLIPVFTGTLQYTTAQLCNARDLHAFLEVGKDFSTWIKDRIEQYELIEGEDYIRSPNLVSGSPNLANQDAPTLGSDRSEKGHFIGANAIDYHLPIDTAKELAMIENNPQGRKVRRYFIRLEKQLRSNLPLLPADKKAAKESWALFRELVQENKASGMDDATAWMTAGIVTKEATGANLLEYMGHPHIGGDASLLLAHKEDTAPVKGFKSPQGKLLDWKQRMAVHMSVVELTKAAPHKFQFAFMAYNWLVRTMNVSCEEQIPQHRFIEALNILRVKAECEREAV
jgi:phage anti-repressor protein